MREFGSELIPANEPLPMDLHKGCATILVGNMNFHGRLYFVTDPEVASYHPLWISSDVKVATFFPFVMAGSPYRISEHSVFLSHQHGQHARWPNFEKLSIESP
jgi:hypothetical protein